MSGSHAHGERHRPGPAPGTPAAAARRRLHRLLAAILVPVVLLTIAGLVLLRAGSDEPQRFPSGLGPQTDLVRAELLSRETVPCPAREGEELVPTQPGPEVAQTECVSASIRLLSGPDSGDRFVLDVLSTPVEPFPQDGGCCCPTTRSPNPVSSTCSPTPSGARPCCCCWRCSL